MYLRRASFHGKRVRLQLPSLRQRVREATADEVGEDFAVEARWRHRVAAAWIGGEAVGEFGFRHLNSVSF